MNGSCYDIQITAGSLSLDFSIPTFSILVHCSAHLHA